MSSFPGQPCAVTSRQSRAGSSGVEWQQMYLAVGRGVMAAGIHVKLEDTGFPPRSQNLEINRYMVWGRWEALKMFLYTEGDFGKSPSRGSFICGPCDTFCVILSADFHTLPQSFVQSFIFSSHRLLKCTVRSSRVEIVFSASPYPQLLTECPGKCKLL